MRLSSLVTVVFSLIIAACAASSNTAGSVKTMKSSVNAQKYGENAPKIWTELTPIEMGALLKAKNEPDNETTFVISLFLTGNVRTGEEIGPAIAAYRDFKNKCDTELSKVNDLKEKGKKLHELFFKQFIGTPRVKGSPSSGLSGLLLKKEYDNNTAVLLFSIVAKEYGFIPEISFTEGKEKELKAKNSELTMEIFSGRAYLSLKHDEMYSDVHVFPLVEDGFDPYVSISFFENLHKSDPEDFKEPEIEMKKYYSRKTMSFNEFFLFQYKIDKLNEPVENDSSPIYRRIEMSAFLTDSCEILLDRVWAWRNIYPFILQRKIPGETLVFIETITEELNRTADICGNESEFEALAWDLFLFSSFEYSESLNGEKLKDSLMNSYNYLSTSSENYEKKRTWLSNALNFYLDKIISSDLIEQKLETVKKVIGVIPVADLRAEAASSFYYKSGEHYLKNNDLWRAGSFYAECAFVYGGKHQKTCVQKGVDTLYKYAQTCLGRGVCATASDAVSKCMEKIPDKNECKKIKDLYDQKCGK